MWRCIAILMITTSFLMLQVSAEDLEEIFYDTDNSVAPECPAIEGGGYGCYNCYSCNNPEYTKHVNHSIENITRNTNCGQSNPEGWPRRVRPSLRYVLPGQFPWRAWVYDKDIKDILCGAVYISEDGALLTAATCVFKISTDNLAVKFDKDSDDMLAVKEVVIHPDFDMESHVSDIAILLVRAGAARAGVACAPLAAPAPAAPCVAVSTDSMLINCVVPRQSRCNATLPHPSLLCATTPFGDFEPEYAGGLFCMSQHSNTIMYNVFGIMLEHNKYLTYYTNVYYHMDWINSKINGASASTDWL